MTIDIGETYCLEGSCYCEPGTTTTTIYHPPKTIDSLRILIYKSCAGQLITVKVVNPRSKPVKGADVDVYLNEKKVTYGDTDSEGIFKFTPEEPGEYYITASKTKYYDDEREVEITECEKQCKEDSDNCEEDGDCCSNYCYAGTCRTPSCYDGILNQGEEKINQLMSWDPEDIADCGGPCDPCPTCFDEIQNQGEAGIDCGGPCQPCCPTCASCSDGVKNQGEADIDCGGPCDSCFDGESCKVDEDCASDYCYQEACRTPSCEDEILNQEEEGIDCGGPCDPCYGVGIVGSMVRFARGSGGLGFLLFLLISALSYFSYKTGKRKGMGGAKIEETAVDEVLEEKKAEE